MLLEREVDPPLASLTLPLYLALLNISLQTVKTNL